MSSIQTPLPSKPADWPSDWPDDIVAAALDDIHPMARLGVSSPPAEWNAKPWQELKTGVRRRLTRRNGHAPSVPPNANPRYVEATVRAELASLAARPTGSRNTELNNVALNLGRLVPTEARDWLREQLIDACHSNGLIADDGQQSVEATIKSGFRKADEEGPRDVPEPKVPAPKVTEVTELPISQDSADAFDPSPLADMRDGAWLDAQDFPPLKFSVEGIVPEGFGLLVGPPKAGKSWLVADLGLAVACGGKALGRIYVGKRPVLYLALEDGHRRLQSRFRRVLGKGQSIPVGMHHVIKAQPDQVIPMIQAFLKQNAGAEPLVILDTFGKVKPPRKASQDAYQADYAIGTHLKDAVDAAPGATLLVVHHTRKAETSDFVDAVSGTHGVAGSADFVLVLKRKRHSQDATLSVTGRDVPEAEYALRAVEGVLWQLVGADLRESARQAQKQRETERLGDRTLEVLAFVNDREQTTPADVKDTLDLDHRRAQETLGRLAETGRIQKLRRGVYAPVSAVSAVSAVIDQNAQVSNVFQIPHRADTSAVSAVSDDDDEGQPITAPPNDYRTSPQQGADNFTASDQALPHLPHTPAEVCSTPDCTETLLAPESVARGYCERCHRHNNQGEPT